ncbi:MAG: hypothetical protein PVF27_07780 [Gemmatimonadales bacterium]
MTKMLVPVLLVLLALALVAKDARAPGAEINQGVRLLGYELRIGVSLRPVPPPEPVAAVVPDSLTEAVALAEEVAR